MNKSDKNKPAQNMPKQTKKKKTTYGIKITENLTIAPAFDLITSLPIVTLNGMPIENKDDELIYLPVSAIKKMLRFYTINKEFMNEHELKLATTIIEYNDKFGLMAAILLPTNELMARSDISTIEELNRSLNRATRHDMDYQMRLRRQLIAKIAKLRKQRKK